MMLPPYSVGLGYDIHRLVPDRKLFLCGVEIPHSLGLEGHSDADVALHALCDALLGAVGQNDIGYHFPPTDDRYKDCRSTLLTRHVVDLVHGQGYRVSNADIVIIAQRPKLLPFIATMRDAVSALLQTPFVNIKATTNEHLDATGREEGIAAQAVVLLMRQENKPS